MLLYYIVVNGLCISESSTSNIIRSTHHMSLSSATSINESYVCCVFLTMFYIIVLVKLVHSSYVDIVKSR